MDGVHLMEAWAKGPGRRSPQTLMQNVKSVYNFKGFPAQNLGCNEYIGAELRQYIFANTQLHNSKKFENSVGV